MSLSLGKFRERCVNNTQIVNKFAMSDLSGVETECWALPFSSTEKFVKLFITNWNKKDETQAFWQEPETADLSGVSNCAHDREPTSKERDVEDRIAQMNEERRSDAHDHISHLFWRGGKMTCKWPVERLRSACPLNLRPPWPLRLRCKSKSCGILVTFVLIRNWSCLQPWDATVSSGSAVTDH